MQFKILILVILVLINAFFASAEIAFISLNEIKVSKKAKEGDKKSKLISKMLENPSKFLATIQIGITLAGFLSSAFAAESFAGELAVVLEDIIPLGVTTWTNISIILITIILSYFSLVFGELVPKRIAMKYYEKVAYATVRFIKILSVITSPFVKFLTFSTNMISKLFGISEKDEEIVTENDIKDMLEAGNEDGTIEEEERELINNVFEFNDKITSEIMRHRTEIFALEINTNINEVIEELEKYKFSRIPVYEDTIDNIKGILYIKDMIKYIHSNKAIKIKELIKKPYFVSENKPIDELFRELQKNKKQAAVVVDEFGGTSGFVTMEDILEELVGNIFDEYDRIENEYEMIDDNTYIISGSMPIFDVEKILDIKIEEGDYDTISGYLLELLGKVPADGEQPIVETDDVTYKITKVKNQRIIQVKACINKQINLDDTEEE